MDSGVRLCKPAAMSRNCVALLLVLIAALGVRLAYVFTTGHNAYATSHDAEVAHNILDHGRWFVFDERTREFVDDERPSEYPLAPRLRRNYNLEGSETDFAQFDKKGRFYPEIGESVGSMAVLAGLWAVTGGERYLPLQITQAIVDALAALLVYRIAMRLFNIRRAALFAGALYALYPPIAWQTTIPYNDIWAIDFTIAVVACYMEVLNSPHRWRWLVACGLCAGLGSYFRPNVVVIAPIIALATIAMTGWREALRRGGCVTLVAAVLVAPWTIRNYNDFHKFIPATSSFWENMEDGLGELPNSYGATNHDYQIKEEVRRVRPDLRPESPEWDDYLKPRVMRTMEHHPLYYLKLLGYRVVLATLWKHDQVWMNSAVPPLLAYKGGIVAFAVDQPVDLLEYALQPTVFLLAVLTLILTWRRWRRQHVILLAIAAGVLLPYILITVNGRYILPAEFTYFVWIGLGVHLLLERVRLRFRFATPRARMLRVRAQS